MNGFIGGVTLAACVAASSGCGELRSTQLLDAAQDSDAPAPDAAPDAPGAKSRYDVAYFDELTIGWNRAGGGALGFMVVVNNGPDKLSLDNIAVQTTDNHPAVTSNFYVDRSSSTPLEPGWAAGELSAAATAAIAPPGGSGLVTEPRENVELLFGLNFSGVLETMVGLDLQVMAKAQIDGLPIELPFTVHIVGDQVTTGNHARRVPATMPPP